MTKQRRGMQLRLLRERAGRLAHVTAGILIVRTRDGARIRDAELDCRNYDMATAEGMPEW